MTEAEIKALNGAHKSNPELHYALSLALIDKYGNKNRCGDCAKWMKSRECPRERNVKGMSRGPSCNDYPCDQFAAKSGS